jgi:hypothetical protein
VLYISIEVVSPLSAIKFPPYYIRRAMQHHPAGRKAASCENRWMRRRRHGRAHFGLTSGLAVLAWSPDALFLLAGLFLLLQMKS